MNNQSIDQQRELRRYEDRKGQREARELPWYQEPDAYKALFATLMLAAFAIVFPFFLNWLLTILMRIQVFV